MSDPALDGRDAALEALAWDSAHYGQKVARIRERAPDGRRLTRLLELAESEGVWLLYWLTDSDHPVPASLLSRFGGLRVMGHVRYARSLSGATDADRARPGVAIDAYRGEAADDAALIALGVAAGVLSRFRADPRLPPEKCDEMYELWIQKSMRHELADEVLVARRDGAVAGMLTIKLKGSLATIGLVSTDAAHRGQGVGSALMDACHGWVRARGGDAVEVVTQTENSAACALYERAGYTAAERGEYYHFRLNS